MVYNFSDSTDPFEDITTLHNEHADWHTDKSSPKQRWLTLYKQEDGATGCRY